MKSSFIEVCVSKVAWKLFLAVFEVSGTLNFISSIVDHVFSSEGYSSLFVKRLKEYAACFWSA